MRRLVFRAILLSLPTLSGCWSSSGSGGGGSGGSACAADTQTDSGNCGACGHSCLGGACMAGSCQPVALTSFGPEQDIVHIVLDAGFVYLGLGFGVEDSTNGTSCADKPMVVRVSRTATHEVLELAPCSELEGGGQWVGAMALAGSEIVWNYYDDPAVPNLQRVSTAGGPNVDLGDAAGPFIAADARSVFYGSGSLGGDLAELDVGGGEPKLLAKRSPRDVAIDSANVYFTFSDCMESCQNDWSVFAVPRSGGSPRLLASKLDGSPPLVARGDYLYFGLPVAGARIMRVPTAGGAIETVVPPNAMQAPGAIAVDDSSVYWTWFATMSPSGKGGGLSRAPLDGGPITTLVTSEASPSALAVDDDAIVWATSDSQTGAGTLWLLAK